MIDQQTDQPGRRADRAGRPPPLLKVTDLQRYFVP